MKFVSLRLITDDVTRLADFYARLIGGEVSRPHELFAEVATSVATVAIGHTSTVALFGPGSAHAADNHSAIIELLVPDVDAAFIELGVWIGTFVNEPTTLPWGNRSLLLRDPDGNLVNLFTPATPQAEQKFARFT